MSKIKDGGPAFPTPWAAGTATEGGMTMRDWFACQALTGIFAKCGKDHRKSGEDMPQMLARRAYEFADAMLLARRESGQ